MDGWMDGWIGRYIKWRGCGHSVSPHTSSVMQLSKGNSENGDVAKIEKELANFNNSQEFKTKRNVSSIVVY